MITFNDLYFYQKDAIAFFEKNGGRASVCLPTGSGKTFIASFTRVKHRELLNKMLVICPSAVKTQWASVIRSIFPTDIIYIAEGFFDESFIKNCIDADVVIINYDILARKGKQGIDWKNILGRVKFDYMVVDESHKIKNIDSERSKAVKYVSKSIRYIMTLTATPMLSKPLDLFSQLNLVYPQYYDNYWKFRNTFQPKEKKLIWVKNKETKKPEQKEVWVDGVPKNLDILHKQVQYFLFMVSEADVYKEIPEMSHIVVPVNVTITEEIKNAVREFINTNTSDTVNAQTKLDNVRRLVGMAKIDNVVNWVNDWLETNDTKIVVFTYHRSVSESIKKEFGNKAVLYYGGMSQKDKDESLEKFKNDNLIRVLVGNIGSIGTGVDGLNIVSHTCIFVEPTSVPSEYKQAVGRVRRKNSAYEHYFAYTMIAEETVDEHIINLLHEKQKNIDAIMDGKEIQKDDDLLFIYNKMKNSLR